jgi:hypothetical protein
MRAENAQDPGEPVKPVAPRTDSPQSRVERDLLDLLVRIARIRSRAQYLLDENLLTDATHVAIAREIAKAGSELPAGALAGHLESVLPGAAQVLSGATLGDIAENDAEAVERDMTRKLKVFDLERRIAAGKERLRRGGAQGDDLEYDELFRGVSALQRELEEYRRGVRDVG